MKPDVLLVGFAARPAGLERLPAAVVREAGEAEALDLLAEPGGTVLCLGEELEGDRALRFLDQAAGLSRRCRIVILAAGDHLEPFADLVQGDDLFFLSRRPWPDGELIPILESALASCRWDERRDEDLELDERRRQLLREAAARLDLQEDLASAGELSGLILGELTGADRSQCLLFDAAGEVLWSGRAASRRLESPAVGLVSFVARTGRSLVLGTMREDPRWDRGADDPGGSGAERFLAVPVMGVGGGVAAVLSAVREPGRPPFDAADAAAAARLAFYAGPSLGRLEVRARVDAEEAALADHWRGEASPFRPEALEEHAAGLLGRGEAIRLSPAWVRWAFLLVVALALAGLLAAALEGWR